MIKLKPLQPNCVIGSDEQTLDMRLLGWMSKHIFAKSKIPIYWE